LERRIRTWRTLHGVRMLRSLGITRCPTARALPTQASPGPADRVALQRYAALRNQTRKRQLGGRGRSFWTAKVLAGPGE
jgi:hypothetical protein